MNAFKIFSPNIIWYGEFTKHGAGIGDKTNMYKRLESEILVCLFKMCSTCLLSLDPSWQYSSSGV